MRPKARGQSGRRVRIKRVYDPPAPRDGYRVLVDRLWPRGISKKDLALDAWCKDVAPSEALRRSFCHAVERWDDFVERYRGELRAGRASELVDDLVQRAREGGVTLLYAARDSAHNNAVVLQQEIERRVKARPRRA